MKKRSSLLVLAAAVGFAATTSNVSAVPIIRGTGNAALIGNDLTDLGNNGVKGSYTYPAGTFPANLGGFDAIFFASSEAAFDPPPAGGDVEGAFNVFDNQTGGGSAKWCCQPVSEAIDGSGQFVGADFSQTLAAGPGTGIVLNRFTMTSSNDSTGRDPDVWAIQGSNDGVLWTNIYSTLTNVFSATRNQVLEFSVANGDFTTPAMFDQFRLFVDSTAGAGFFALSELELLGTVVTIPEPATASLSLLGLAGLVMRRRHRNA